MYSIYLNQVWEFGGNIPSVVYQLGYDENMWYNDITSKWRFVWKTWWTMGIRSTFWRHPGSPELNKCCHRFYCCSELCSVEYQVQSFLVILVLSLDVYYFQFQSHENPKSPKSFWTPCPWVISASGRARTRSRGWDAQVQSKGFQHCHALIGQEIEPTHCRTHRLLAWKGTVENQESERKGMNLMLSFTGLILVLFCGALHPNTYSSFLPSINNVQTVHQLLKVHPFWSILTFFFISLSHIIRWKSATFSNFIIAKAPRAVAPSASGAVWQEWRTAALPHPVPSPGSLVTKRHVISHKSHGAKLDT